MLYPLSYEGGLCSLTPGAFRAFAVAEPFACGTAPCRLRTEPAGVHLGRCARVLVSDVVHRYRLWNAFQLELIGQEGGFGIGCGDRALACENHPGLGSVT